MNLREKIENTVLWKKIMDSPFGELFDQILHFSIIGVFNTLLGLVLVELFYNVFHWNYWVSSITSYTIGSIFSYFANKKMTFKVEGNTKSTAWRFAVNIAVCYGLAYGIAKPLVRVVLSGFSQKIVENIALLVGMGLFIIFNFFGQKFFVFKENTHSEES